MLVTDTSGSMNATDVAPSRLAAAQAAATRFLDRVPEVAADRPGGLRRRPDTPSCARRRTTSEVKTTLERARRPTAAPRPATRSTRALTALGARDKKSPPAAIVLLSDGASKTGQRPGRRSRRRPRAAASRSTPSRSAPPTASSSRAARPSTSPPDPEALARGRAALRRARVHRRGRRRARRGLPDARLADRHQEGEEGDQRGLRRRRSAAARRRGASPRCAGGAVCPSR